MTRIGIVGGGAWGMALGVAAAEAGHAVILWMRDGAAAAEVGLQRINPRALPGIRLPDPLRVVAELGDLGESEILLLVVPAQAVRGALGACQDAIPSGCPVVICAKGIERGTGLFMSDVAAAVRPEAPVAILSGPSFAADVARGLPTAVTLAAREAGLAARLAAALSGPTLRIYHSQDSRGVEIGGAAKNVLAIAAGIVEGRRLGESAKAALVARGFAELLRFAAAQGGRPETLMGLSGLGDLVLTCASPQSRNFSLGLRLGAGGSAAEAGDGKLAEGAYTADALVAIGRAAGQELPICEAVAAVLAGTLSVDAAAAALMSRPLRQEG